MPRGAVRWEAPQVRSQPLLFSAEWRPTASGRFQRDEGEARISAPLPPAAEREVYVSLHVRSERDPKFTNPTVIDDTMLDGGGGLMHMAGSNLYFFNARWRDVVAFGKDHPRLYLFAVRNLALNRAEILAQFEIDPAAFVQADTPIRAALDDVERMVATPAASCSAVDDLPPPPIVVEG